MKQVQNGMKQVPNGHLTQVKNGHLYTRYRRSSQNEMCEKSLQTTSLSYSNAKCTPEVPLTVYNPDKTKHKNIDFVHLLSSFASSSPGIIQSILCMQILNVPMIALLTCYIPTCFEHRVTYERQVID